MFAHFRYRQQLPGSFDTRKGNFLRGAEGQIFAVGVIACELSNSTWRLFGEMQRAHRAVRDR